eukprot:tig00021462_g21585.t1
MQALTEAASEIRSNAAWAGAVPPMPRREDAGAGGPVVGRAEEQRRAVEGRATGLAGPARSLLASVAAVEGAFARAFCVAPPALARASSSADHAGAGAAAAAHK